MTELIKVEALRKNYGTLIVIDDVSFDVEEGEIFGMVGPNGAGKTTTIECLEGLRKPDHGTINVLGVDPQCERHFLYLHSGIQLQQSNLPDRMRVWEAMDLYSSFYPKVANWKVLLDQLGLEEKRNAFFGKLSGGQKQRLFIAMALLPDPRLLFLDELTTGLDPQARHAIWDLVHDVRARGKTILMTTHFMEEAERLCDRVAILDHGRIVAMDSPVELIHRHGGGEKLCFRVDEAIPSEVIHIMHQFGRVEIQEKRVIIRGNSSQSTLTSDIVSLLAQHGIHFSELRSEQSSLEDAFLALTGNEMKD